MSIDFIPLAIYTPFYYYIILVITLFVFFELQNKGMSNSSLGIFLLLFVTGYMGFRPISFYFGDMGTYARLFDEVDLNGAPTFEKDFVFNAYIQFSSKLMTANLFFFTSAILYVTPIYFACRKWFKKYWFYAFLMAVGSFSFWAYGTNGIRNGLATSVFLFGISRDKRVFQFLAILLAVGVHKSLMLPALGFVLAQVYNKPKVMIAFWAFCIPLSLVSGGFWEALFSNLGFDDDRLSYLTQGNVNDDDFSSTGFRWDFLLYSATAVFAGWFYIVKKNFNDKVYFWLFNTYVFANAFWILVIRANFSNRFAYLSWFMMSMVIIYPLLKTKLVSKQNRKLAFVILIYFLFTFIMNAILTKY